MIDLPSLRRQYGSVFVTTLENGSTIPWKQLSVGEFLEYSLLMDNGTYSKATIEDEIFKKCVVDEHAIQMMPALKAGTVTTVAKDIMSHSGPEDIMELNQTLMAFRGIAGQAIHQTVMLISQAFPAYKLEEIYDLDYGDFMLRLAQAEYKLLQVGVLQEPINFRDPSFENQEEEAPPQKRPMDMYLDYLEQEKNNKASQAKSKKQEQTIITATDMRSQNTDLLGHEKQDRELADDQMVKDAYKIYGDYMKQINSGEELEIKTPEERVAEAEKRAEVNQEVFVKASISKRKKERELEEHYQAMHKRLTAKKRK